MGEGRVDREGAGELPAQSAVGLLFLTKFPRRYVGLEFPPTAWLGTSVDEQKRVRLAEEAFRQRPRAVKWLSLEPLLAPLEFSDLSMFDWVVIGAQTETYQPDGKGGRTSIRRSLRPSNGWRALSCRRRRPAARFT